jgi:hypothetical protein
LVFRYTDDCNITSDRTERWRISIPLKFLERRPKLKANIDKGAGARPWKLTFLGYPITAHLKPRIKWQRIGEVIRKKLKKTSPGKRPPAR